MDIFGMDQWIGEVVGEKEVDNITMAKATCQME